VKEPKLRTADKIAPPYPLGRFPSGFVKSIGKQIIYLFYTKPTASLEGEEWERIFANAVGAEWKPSNIGLDDIISRNCAWGAKTVKNSKPWSTEKVRLISGRNSPVYSYGSTVGVDSDPDVLGKEVLNIWNARVESIRAKYSHVRTVVLIKSNDLLELTIFEVETVRYDVELYNWRTNRNGNLEGWKGAEHCFTWQPHGSQFTIVEKVPDNKVCIRLRNPGKIEESTVLDMIGFDDSWVEVINP
jgi:hypothetical protein